MNQTESGHFQEPEAARVTALKLPERAAIAPENVRQADMDLLACAPADFMDTTHFDTVRFPPPDWALTRFSEAAKCGALAYTGYRGHPNVLEKVAENISRFMGVTVDPERHIALTPGTQSALFAVLSSRVNSGDRVALVDPDYLFTARMLRFLGADIGYVPLRHAGALAEPDLEALEAEFARRETRHFVFSHPNNPTGAVFSKATVRSIAELAARYGVSIVADELYSRLVHDDVAFPHIAAEDGMFNQVATLLGPSKTESLSGYRLGVVVGSDALMRSVENVLSITALRAPAYAQHILPSWLVDDHDWLRDRLRAFQSLRDMTVRSLTELPWLKLHPQQGTAYLWPDVSALDLPDSTIARALLEKAGVLISPGYQFGPTANGHFRICYARDEKPWLEALDRMLDVLDGFAAPKGLPGRERR